MGININVYLHGLDDIQQIRSLLTQLTQQGASTMATVDELVEVAGQVAEQVGLIGPAVDALEQKITDALAQVPGGIPADAQAKIDAAVATLQAVVSNAKAVVADATDGINEAATPANP